LPSQFNWTGGKLVINTSVSWGKQPSATTGTIFGSALTLGNAQNLTVIGNETLSTATAFSLILNSGSSHTVTGTLTLPALGTITQNAGSTLNVANFVQTGGTVNGTLQNQGNFTYQSGAFNGRLLNQGTLSLGSAFTAGNGIENDTSMS